MTNQRRFFLSIVFAALFSLFSATQVAGAATPGLQYTHNLGNNGFFVAKHATAACVACHAGENYLSRSRDRCEDCHGRRHGADFVNACGRCHTSSSWKQAKPAHIGKLGGAHVKLGCRKCHLNNKYTGLKGWRCPQCHAGPAAHSTTGCAHCHSKTAWLPATGSHGIKLNGVHKSLKCVQCHTSGQFTKLSWGCGTCHKSTHPSSYSTKCSLCHNQKNWTQASVDHAGTSGDCSGCHQAPAAHYPGNCSQCHKVTTSWAATFNHPKVGEHTSKSFPCSYCHPKDYASSTCTRCHANGAPGD